MQATECALNAAIVPGSATCIPKTAIVDYYAAEDTLPPPKPAKAEAAFVQEVCGGDCSTNEFINKLSNSADARMRRMYMVAYKPQWPAAHRTNWPLTNLEIDHVQNQYMYRTKNYVAIKTWYVDFMKTLPDVYLGFKFLDYAKNKANRYIGFVYNTDRYPNPGIHWIAVLIDVRDGVFEVFDSFGKPPAKEILAYYEVVKRALHPAVKNLKFVANTKGHQSFTSDECGIYALYYIWLRLTGKTMAEINETSVDSAFMRKFRHIYFRK